jgi:hypothetical protein
VLALLVYPFYENPLFGEIQSRLALCFSAKLILNPATTSIIRVVVPHTHNAKIEETSIMLARGWMKRSPNHGSIEEEGARMARIEKANTGMTRCGPDMEGTKSRS